MREAREEFTGWVVCEGVFCISKRFFQYLTIITVESFESTIVQFFVEVSLFFLVAQSSVSAQHDIRLSIEMVAASEPKTFRAGEMRRAGIGVECSESDCELIEIQGVWQCQQLQVGEVMSRLLRW